ncbi:hypothetical protein AAG906_026145 [Vitis piasezkii]
MVKTTMAGASRGSVTTWDVVESIQNDSIALSNEAKHLSIIASNSLQLIVNKKWEGEVKKPANNDPCLKTWLINSMDLSIGKPFLFIPIVKEVLSCGSLDKEMEKLLCTIMKWKLCGKKVFSEIRREESRQRVMLQKQNQRPTLKLRKNHGVIIVRSHGIRMIHVGSYMGSLRIGKRRMGEMVVCVLSLK